MTGARPAGLDIGLIVSELGRSCACFKVGYDALGHWHMGTWRKQIPLHAPHEEALSSRKRKQMLSKDAKTRCKLLLDNTSSRLALVDRLKARFLGLPYRGADIAASD